MRTQSVGVLACVLAMVAASTGAALTTRVFVTGPPGCGKSVFAAALASALGVIHVEVDEARFVPGTYVKVDLSTLRDNVRALVGDARSWVMDSTLYDGGDATRLLFLAELQGVFTATFVVQCHDLEVVVANIYSRSNATAAAFDQRQDASQGPRETPATVAKLVGKTRATWDAIQASLAVYAATHANVTVKPFPPTVTAQDVCFVRGDVTCGDVVYPSQK
jgi:hypothetical protein